MASSTCADPMRGVQRLRNLLASFALSHSSAGRNMEEDAAQNQPPAAVPADPRDVEKRFDLAMRRLARSWTTVPDADSEPAAPDAPLRDDL